MAGASFVDVAVTDLDGDRIEEIAALDENTGSLRIFSGSTGSLSMVDEVPLDGAVLGAAEIAAVDIDGDDRNELVIHAATEVLIVGRVATSCP